MPDPEDDSWWKLPEPERVPPHPMVLFLAEAFRKGSYLRDDWSLLQSAPDLCARPPFGCGEWAFTASMLDPLARANFTVIRFCMDCQDKLFMRSPPRHRITPDQVPFCPIPLGRCTECGQYMDFVERDGHREVNCCPTWYPGFRHAPSCDLVPDCRFGRMHFFDCEKES